MGSRQLAVARSSTLVLLATKTFFVIYISTIEVC